MYTRQGTDDGGEIIAKQPTAVSGSKTRNSIMVVFITEDNAFYGAFKLEHIYSIILCERCLIGINCCYISTVRCLRVGDKLSQALLAYFEGVVLLTSGVYGGCALRAAGATRGVA